MISLISIHAMAKHSFTEGFKKSWSRVFDIVVGSI